MRSAASYKGHPIHPALIPFPFAFLVGAFLFDLGGTVLERPPLWITARHLAVAGVASALLAGAFGVVDYLRTVPPESSGKRRATWHALANLGATLLFATVWVLRGEGPPGLTLLGLEGAGTVLLVMGGWMGGTLTFRNQIGVDHRYAGAGKWSHQRLSSAGGSVRVAATDELEVDQMKLLEIDGRRVVLARSLAGWVAFEDRCPHKGGSLAGGVMICGTVMCPWHGSQFDAGSGEVKAGPAEAGIRTFEVEVRKDGVWMQL